MATRKSARIASRTPSIAPPTPTPEDGMSQNRVSRSDSANRAHEGLSPDSDTDDQTKPQARPAKRRKTRSAASPRPKRNPQPRTTRTITTKQPSTPTVIPSIVPSRAHPKTYHNPLLLTSPSSQQSLVTWFRKSIHNRPMPWRKPFLPPSTLTPSALSRRAYEVWISETMLQQTRVATVVGYYTRWMARWPTIFDLAAASEEEVLGMWAGLGYYSRARRVWEAAKHVVGECDGGVLPGDVEGLMKLPGVGRYTAGAVAAIVFGVAAPVVDGNVLRVLSRQMGVLGAVKGDREVVEMLWAAAGELAKAVAGEDGVSERPGLWGQALMELGSTVCMPKPNCAACPITGTCRAYQEGVAMAEGRGVGMAVEDIEELCTMCAPLEDAAEDEDAVEEPEAEATKKEGRLSHFFAPTQPAKPTTTSVPNARTLNTIIKHARKFPLKKPRKKVREEETLVCAIRRSDGRYLIHQRPTKGLLGGLWELPSHTLPESNDSTTKSRKSKAVPYVTGLIATPDAERTVKHLGELGSVPWLFSHLKLTMHVHLFEVDDAADLPERGARQRWATAADIDPESMGTGMKKCWALVKERTG